MPETHYVVMRLELDDDEDLETALDDLVHYENWADAGELGAMILNAHEYNEARQGPMGEWLTVDVDPKKPFLLVEENVRGGWWYSTHESPKAASQYHYTQEYASDWEVDHLINLRTGKRMKVKEVTVEAVWE